METPTETKTIHDALKILCRETDRLVAEVNDNAHEVNVPAEAQLSRRYDAITRQASQLISYHKEVGSKDPIWFFEED